MGRALRLAGVAFVASACLVLTAAKPPASSPSFFPALAYRYTSGKYQDIRLGNADGSAAVLLARASVSNGSPTPISRMSISLARQQLVYLDNSNPSYKKIRLVSWSQASPGGAVTVTADPQPLFSADYRFYVGDVDFSADGTQVAVVGERPDQVSELRIFDVASRSQVGDTITLPYGALYVSWRGDGSLFLSYGNQASVYQDGVQTPLWRFSMDGRADSFNGGAADLILSYNGYLHRWDGVSVNNDTPVLTQLDAPFASSDMSVSCDNQQIIHRTGATRRSVYVYSIATGSGRLYANDDHITFPTFPSSCV